MRVILMIASIIVLALALVFACKPGKETAPVKTEVRTSVKDVLDKKVSVQVARVGRTNKFLLTAKHDRGPDLEWWISADATLLDKKGKAVPDRTPGTSRFHWVEGDEDNKESHAGNFRKDNPIKETLVLDTEGLTKGKYTARPSIRIYERGKGAHPSMRDPYYRDQYGILPGKFEPASFTLK